MAKALDTEMVDTPALHLIDQALMDLVEGREQRLAVFVSPQEGKSVRCSRFFPLFLLERDPSLRLAIVSYSDDIARRWGWQLRLDIETFDGRNHDVDLGLRLYDRPAQGSWRLRGERGGVVCAGVAGSLTGRAFEVIIIDDPVKDLEQANSVKYRERAWRFWQAVIVPRMGPQTKVVLIQCMTGDTPVLMGDGTERPLRDVRPGDTVATYEDGALTTSTVRNWANQGPDSIFKVRLQSGRVVRANARHPFLTVDEDGVEKWRRTDELRPGSVIRTATGGGGEPSPALRTAATSPSPARNAASRTTTRSGGPTGSVHRLWRPNQEGLPSSATSTASALTSTTECSRSKAASVRLAGSRHLNGPAPTGTEGSTLTTTTPPDGSEGCSAATATSPSGTPSLLSDSVPPLPTWNLEPDEVVEVAPCGVEDVFDLQIDRTENFIANGLISHNTRWHEQDLAGKLLEAEGDKAKGGKWRVISIPAQCEDPATDLLGRREGEYMISARGRTVKDWEERRKDVGEYVWAALFQQRPAPAEGGIYKRLWWRYWQPAGEHRIHVGGRIIDLRDCWRFATVDLAASERTSADYTVIAAWARTLAGDLVLLDRVRAKIGEEKHFEHARGLVERWKLDTLFVEKSQHGFSLVREATQHGVPITPLTAETDKVTRALPASAWCSGGRVWLPAGAWWLDEFRDELAGFPASAHDDQADCLAYAVRAAITEWVPLVNRAQQATARAEPEPDPFGGQPEVDWENRAF